MELLEAASRGEVSEGVRVAPDVAGVEPVGGELVVFGQVGDRAMCELQEALVGAVGVCDVDGGFGVGEEAGASALDVRCDDDESDAESGELENGDADLAQAVDVRVAPTSSTSLRGTPRGLVAGSRCRRRRCRR